MASDADADPPGLSMRSTIARSDESRRAWRMASMRVSEPTISPFSGSKPLLPLLIVPVA